MNDELIAKYHKLLSLAANKFEGASDNVISDIEEDFMSVKSLRNDMDDFSQYLSMFEEAISNDDKQGSVEAMLLARVVVCSVENAYSNLAESVEKLAVELRDFNK